MVLWVQSYFVDGNAGVEGKQMEKQLNLGDGNSRHLQSWESYSAKFHAVGLCRCGEMSDPQEKRLGGPCYFNNKVSCRHLVLK